MSPSASPKEARRPLDNQWRRFPQNSAGLLDSGPARAPLDGPEAVPAEGAWGAASEMGFRGAAPAPALTFPAAGRFLLLAQDDFHPFWSDSVFPLLLDVSGGASFLGSSSFGLLNMA